MARPLKQALIDRLQTLGGLEPRPSKVAGGVALFFNGRELAHFHGADELDVRLTKKVIRELGLTHRSNSSVHPGRAAASDWFEFRFTRRAHLEPIVLAVVRALDEYR